jgi:nonsense-mediated mRNA decay protein 3
MYPNRRKLRAQRHWQLANLEIEEMDDGKKTTSTQKELQREEFMKDLEEDPEMRSQIELYKGTNSLPVFSFLITSQWCECPTT